MYVLHITSSGNIYLWSHVDGHNGFDRIHILYAGSTCLGGNVKLQSRDPMAINRMAQSRHKEL